MLVNSHHHLSELEVEMSFSTYICTCIHRAGNRRIHIANCESLWQSDSPNFLGSANHFRLITNHFLNGFAEIPFFGLHPFFRQISPFSDKFYVKKQKTTFRIMIRNLQINLKSIHNF